MDGLLSEVRARAAARGMTIAALARAAGMQPSNLRRMLGRTSTTTRLETVMRLLRPLHCHIFPTGAHTSAELAAALDAARRRRGVSWEELIGSAAAHLRRDPQRIPLDVVMRIAAGLGVELTLAGDADEEPHHDAPSGERAAPVTASASPVGSEPMQPGTPPPRARAQRRRPAASSSGRATAAGPGAPMAGRPASSAPTQDAPVPASSSSPTASAPSADANPLALGPLRPPRLGRYRDLPDQPRARPAPASPASWKPRKPQQEWFALGDAVAEQLADFSGSDWRDLLSLIWKGATGVASVPAHIFEGMGNMVAAGLARLRRPRSPDPPAAPDPPDEWFDELDISALMPHWVAAHAPGYRPQDLYLHHDDHGLLVGHVALDNATMAAVRMAPRGHAHQLVNVLQQLPGGGLRRWLAKEVPLAITIGGERRVFRHIHAGPIFGEIVLGDRAYFLAAISALLVLVEVQGEAAKLVWGGRAEGLPRLALAAPQPEPAATQAPSEVRDNQAAPDHAQTDVPAALRQDVGPGREPAEERPRRQAAEQAHLELREKIEVVAGELDGERQRRVAADHARAALADELEVLRRELADERERRQVLEHEQAAAMGVIDMARKAAVVLPAELAAQSAARERSATEARLATRMLEKTMEILVRHAPADVAVEWKRQIVAALVDGRSDIGPEELEVVTRFAEQFIDAFGGATARPDDQGVVLEVKPASVAAPSADSELPRPGERAEVAPGEPRTPTDEPATGDEPAAGVPEGVMMSSDAGFSPAAAPLPARDAAVESVPVAVDVTGAVAEPGYLAPTSSVPSPGVRATPARPGRARERGNWALPDPVESASKPSPAQPKVGRNDPCPCGSGKKFKKCCWRP